MEVKVLVELKAKSIEKTFTYNVPIDIEDKIKIGIRVLVPFANRKLEGFVLDIKAVQKKLILDGDLRINFADIICLEIIDWLFS